MNKNAKTNEELQNMCQIKIVCIHEVEGGRRKKLMVFVTVNILTTVNLTVRAKRMYESDKQQNDNNKTMSSVAIASFHITFADTWQLATSVR